MLRQIPINKKRSDKLSKRDSSLIKKLYYQVPSHPYLGTRPITSLLLEKQQLILNHVKAISTLPEELKCMQFNSNYFFVNLRYILSIKPVRPIITMPKIASKNVKFHWQYSTSKISFAKFSDKFLKQNFSAKKLHDALKML